MRKTFGDKIRSRRKELEMTLEELGEKISSTKAYVWELENKTNARPSAEKLFKLAEALEVRPEFLINDDADEDEDNAKDKVFFRKFQKLSEQDKETLRKILGTFPAEKK